MLSYFSKLDQLLNSDPTAILLPGDILHGDIFAWRYYCRDILTRDIFTAIIWRATTIFKAFADQFDNFSNILMRT